MVNNALCDIICTTPINRNRKRAMYVISKQTQMEVCIRGILFLNEDPISCTISVVVYQMTVESQSCPRRWEYTIS